MWGGKTSEYRLASRAAVGSGATALLSALLAYVARPVWVGVALAAIAGFVFVGVLVSYFFARAEVKRAEALSAPLVAAHKTTSRSV